MQLQTAIAASLLDEATFMAELKTLEVGLSSLRTPANPVQPSADTVGAALFDLPAPVRTSGVFVDDDEPVERTVDGAGDEVIQGPSLLWRATAAVMFVLMMGVGAAGAAAVFHERVSRLVAVWQPQQ